MIRRSTRIHWAAVLAAGLALAEPNRVAVQAQVATALRLVDIGGPVEPGRTLDHGGGSFTIIGGGADIWDTSDQCHFAYEVRAGDFDVRVRVEHLEPVHRWSKAGLMVRESEISDSRMIFNRVTPEGPTRFPTDAPFGQNDTRFAYRSGFDDGAGSNGGQHEEGVGQSGYPSAWLRLRRSGDVIIGYTGIDGLNWTEQSRQDTARWAGGPLSSVLLVGLAVTSHENTTGNSARAEFRDLSPTPKLPLRIVQQPRDAVVQEGRMAMFRVVVSGYDPYTFQWFKDGLPLPGATSDTLQWFATAADDGARFSVLADNEVSRELSQAAGLKVPQDITPPRLLSASADETFTRVRLVFSEELDSVSAFNPASYQLDGGLFVLAVELLDDRFLNILQLTTTRMEPGATYHLTLSDLRDRAGNVVPAGNQTTFRAWTFAAWATGLSTGPPGDAGAVLTFLVTNDNNALFSAQPAIDGGGTLTFTPAPEANGSATVTVSLMDDGGTANGGTDTSAAQTSTITVAAVNDAPSFAKGADQVVNEDAGAQTAAGWATAISAGAANESGQALTFEVSNDNAGLFSAPPTVASNGTLTYTPAADANGSATVTVSLKDDGGTANGGLDTSAAQTFTIIVTAVNDEPRLAKGPDQTVNEDAGAQTMAGWATAISAGAANESDQVLIFQVSNDNTGLFSAQPVIAANGTLTHTPAANANGSATVTVSLKDDGGTANGGVDTSATQAFTITV
ncbi:MAG: hypothetical protein HYY24_15150, partial [Verrucomicrobia bacterium]|nr:hypothetical protein [Verrucomicrobiota bacterium]